MTQILDTRDEGFARRFAEILERGQMDITQVSASVQKLLDEIKREGETALLRHIASFDKWQPSDFGSVRIDPKDCQKAYEALNTELKNSLHIAYERIFDFHSKQKEKRDER